MNKHEQADHDHAVEAFVDETLAGARSLLTLMEKDIKLCETVIPAEDTTLWNTTALRVSMISKLFEAYGATLMLNDHVRRVLTAPGRNEVNSDIDVRLKRADAWMTKVMQSNVAVRKMVDAMGWAARTAGTLYNQQPGEKPRL